MSKNKLLKLLVITIFLGMVLLVTKIVNSDTSIAFQDSQEPLLKLAGKDISTIRIADGDNEVILHRKQGSWFLKQHNDFPVAKGRVSLLFQKLGIISAGKRIEATPQYYKQLKLDVPKPKDNEHSGILVEFFTSSKESYCSLVIGKTIHNPKSADGKYSAWYPDRRYMRMDGEKDFVWLVNDPLYEVTTFMGDWIDNNVIIIKQPQQISVEKLNQKNSFWGMTKKINTWGWESQPNKIGVPPQLGDVANELFERFIVLEVSKEQIDFSESFILTVKDKEEVLWQLIVGKPHEDLSQGYMERMSSGMFQRQGIKLKYPIKVDILNFKEKKMEEQAEFYRSWTFWVKSEELFYFLVTKKQLQKILKDIQHDYGKY